MSIGPGGKGTKVIKTKYPYVDGLTAETTKQTGHKESLEAQSGSIVPSKDKAGL